MDKIKEIEKFKEALDQLEETGASEVSWVVLNKKASPESQLSSFTLSMRSLFPDLQALAFLQTGSNLELQEALRNLLSKLEGQHTLAQAKKMANEMDIVLGA